MKLDGKVALITGAASGIGHAIARRYVEAGGKVVIADLNADGAAKAASELGDTKTAIGVGMDVSKEDQVNAGVEQAVDLCAVLRPFFQLVELSIIRVERVVGFFL